MNRNASAGQTHCGIAWLRERSLVIPAMNLALLHEHSFRCLPLHSLPYIYLFLVIAILFMIPLVLFWGLWLRKISLECGWDVQKWSDRLSRGNAVLELVAIAPIETATLIWIGLVAVCTALDRWLHFRIRGRKIDPFAFLTAVALAEELYLRFRYKEYFTSLPWRCAVAYVAANHFLFGAHHILSRGVTTESPVALRQVQSFCENELENVSCRTRLRHKQSLERTGVNITSELAGVGCMLMSEQEEHYGLLSAIWSFNEHRLADVWVHFGVAIQCPYRLDHWVALATHLCKYCGYTIPASLTVPMINGSLSRDNLIDVVAHSASGVLILGWVRFILAVILAELHRWLLDAEVARHHRSNPAPPPVQSLCSCQEADAGTTSDKSEKES